MADTYRGLTIRIGGDATSLQKALRSVNSSISATEQQLRKMKQALQMDPENMGAIETNLRLVGQRAVEAQQRLAQLKSSLKEIGSQKVELLGGSKSAQTIRQLADATDDANARAAEAKRNYAEVTEQLARVKNEISSISGFDLSEETNVPEAVESLRQLGLISDDLADKYQRLNSKWKDAFDENEVAKAVAGVKDLEVEISRSDAEAQSLARRFSELSRASRSIDFGEGLDDQLKMVDAAAKDVNDELRRLDSALKLDDGNVDALALKMRDMREASTLAERKIELLQQKLSRMNAEGIGNVADDTQDVALAAQRAADEYDKVTSEVTRLQGEISELSSRQSLLDSKDLSATDEYRELGNQIDAARRELDMLVTAQREARSAADTASQVQEYRQLQTELAETRAQANKLNDEMREMRKFSGITQGSLVSLGMSLSTTVTPAITALGYGMVDAANTIDAAYRDMRKTVNGTEEDFENLRQAAIDFSSTNVTSADQILSIQAIGGELGVATEDLKVFAETVSNMDVATDLDAEEAATALGQLSNIISDLTGDKFPNFADALVRLGNNGASTESAIADVASRIGAMGSIVGMTTPEILAWASTIASTGQGSEAAGTAISRTMSDIETAVANGGDALDAFADIAGMSAEEFARAWTDTPSAAMQDFIEGLVRVEDDGGSAITTLDELGITAVRQVQSIQGLMQMIEGLDNNLAMSEDAWNGVSDEWGEAGDAAREAERKAEGFSGSLSRLQNMAQNVGSELGESLAPAIDMVTDFLGDLYEEFVDLDDGTKQGIVAVGAFVAALGPLMLLEKGVSEFFGGIGKGIDKLKNVGQATAKVTGLTKVFEKLSPAVEGATGLLGGGFAKAAGVVAVGAVAALVAALVHERQEAEKTKRATEGLREACSVAREGMTDAAESTESYTEQIFDARDATDEMKNRLVELADSFDEINREASIDLDGLRRAESAVHDLEGRSDLTAQEVGELKSAISELNDQCGTNYEVVRDTGGAYQVMEDGVRKTKDEIYELIDAQRQQVIAEAQNKKLSEYYEAQYDNLEAYNETSKDYVKALQDQEEARQRYIDRFGVDPIEGIQDGIGFDSDEAREWGEASSAVANLNSQLMQQKELVDNDQRNIDKLNASIGNMEAAASGAYEGIQALVMSRLNEAFSGDTDVMLDFAEALDEAGFSTKYLSELSDTQLTDLANAWQATGGDIEESMRLAGLAVTDNVNAIYDSLRSMSSSELTGLLSGAGMTLDQLVAAMDRAGIQAETLNEIGSENFAQLVANCGGDVDQLIWMLQYYNAQPIYNKDGSINVNDVPLMDALNNTYVWNGQELKTITGQIVIYREQIEDANGEIYTWNSQGELLDPKGQVLVDYTELTLANGEIATYNNGQLVTQEGEVIVGFDTLTDCNGAMVDYNGTTLDTIEGQVNVDYHEVTDAITAVDSLTSRNGRSATIYLNTVRTTTNRIVTQRINSGPTASTQSLSRAARVSVPVPASSVPLASPNSQLAARGRASVAETLAADPRAMSDSVSRVVTSAARDEVSRAARGGSGVTVDNSEVVEAIGALRKDVAAMRVVLDTGELVGGIEKKMDRALGRMQRRGSLA